MQAYLGVVPLDDRDGCLQDVHWYAGSIGNILSAQFYAAALKARPGIPREIATGEFGALNPFGCTKSSIDMDANSSRTNLSEERPASR